MTEQFRFQKIVGILLAVHGDERLPAPAASAVNFFRYNFFTGSGLSGDKHIGTGIRHQIHQIPDLLHLRIFAVKQVFHRCIFTDGLHIFHLQAGNGFRNFHEKLVRVMAFHEVPEGSQLHGLYGGLDGAVAGGHNDFDAALIPFLQFPQQLDAIHARHGDV